MIENLETLHFSPTLFYHLPGFYLKTGFLNPHPFSLILVCNLCLHFARVLLEIRTVFRADRGSGNKGGSFKFGS